MNIFKAFFLLLLPLTCFGQFCDNFSKGNIYLKSDWVGDTLNFTVNNTFQLQSKAKTTSVSHLARTSLCINNAIWECLVKTTYPTSSSNYACVYVVSDNDNMSVYCNGYFVQIGGTNDEVSLYLQQGSKKTKIIDGKDKRTDGATCEISIKLTRDSVGNFALYSRLAGENDFMLEGITENNEIQESKYFGLVYSNTNTTGSCYYFDDICVSGDKFIDTIPPKLLSVSIDSVIPNRLLLDFSEKVNCNITNFQFEGKEFRIDSLINKNTRLELYVSSPFQKGLIYTLVAKDVADESGNKMQVKSCDFGVLESPSSNDLIINEIMFENADASVEYLELYNASLKLLDLSGLTVTTRKPSNHSLNIGYKIPNGIWMKPGEYLVLCENADSLKDYYNLTNIKAVTMGWYQLNNDSSTIVILDSNKASILDELAYKSKWHHPLIKNPKGVSLEKINPKLPTQSQASWHSASSTANYATPGYQNSQYRDLIDESNEKIQMIWLENETFTPDGDGANDVCIINYKTPIDGYIGSLSIFNSDGRKVRNVVNNELLSSEGHFVWDGKIYGDKLANMGIYVILFEVYHPQIGDHKEFKIPLAVGVK